MSVVPLEHSQSDTQPLDDSVSVEPPSPRSHHSKVREAFRKVPISYGFVSGQEKSLLHLLFQDILPPRTSGGCFLIRRENTSIQQLAGQFLL
jgi:hypothetical protein